MLPDNPLENFMNHPLNRVSLVSVALITLALSACSSGSKILYDYDKGVDFGSYRTYGFMPTINRDGPGYQGLFTKYMLESVAVEMESRGYTRSDDPDLLVNFNAVLQEKTKVTQTPSAPVGGYYGYRHGFYDPWGGYGYGTDTHVSQYTEGTFNLDLIDARRKQLVWEAVGVGRITDKKLENMEQTVKEGVARFFTGYPFQAGDPVARPVK